jgi:hypothetical protein
VAAMNNRGHQWMVPMMVVISFACVTPTRPSEGTPKIGSPKLYNAICQDGSNWGSTSGMRGCPYCIARIETTCASHITHDGRGGGGGLFLMSRAGAGRQPTSLAVLGSGGIRERRGVALWLQWSVTRKI